MAHPNAADPLEGIPSDELDLLNVVLAYHVIVNDKRRYRTSGNPGVCLPHGATPGEEGSVHHNSQILEG